MSKVRVGINGFGRMGRLGMRLALERHADEYEVVQINEIKGDAECAAHLLKFDSIHHTWSRDVRWEKDGADASYVVVEGRRILYTTGKTPSDVDWSAQKVDVVLECSGKFKTRAELVGHLTGTVRKVVVSCPVKEKEGALNIVFGVNDHLYEPARHDIVTAASCTTNCIAPAIKVIKEKFGIRRAIMTTIHDVTNTQRIIDLAAGDLRRARSAQTSLIPTSTGSAKAIQVIFPDLKDKINGIAVRVAVQNASISDLVIDVGRPVTVKEVNGALEEAANAGRLKGILGVEHRPLVSVDYVNEERSCVVDAKSTMIVDGTLVKLFLWYDNEYGYMARMMDLTAKVASLLAPSRSAL